jgi:hypothetical protein
MEKQIMDFPLAKVQELCSLPSPETGAIIFFTDLLNPKEGYGLNLIFSVHAVRYCIENTGHTPIIPPNEVDNKNRV